MATALRKTGIKLVGDVPWGTHFCLFYETKEDLLDILVPYFLAGLENNELCVWVVSEPLTAEEVRESLRRADPSFDQHIGERSLEILMAREWYVESGTFDLQKVTSGWNAKLGQALVRGYDGLRVSGNTAWLEKKDWENFREYERQLNESIIGQPMAVLCTYSLVASGAAEILDVARNHQFAIAERSGQWHVVETPDLEQTKAEIVRLNQKLEERVIDRTKELRVANEVLRNEIIERQGAEEKLKATTEQLRALSARLQSAREEEGMRIAREVHDELGSALTSLRWDLEGIKNAIHESGKRPQVPGLREKIAAMLGLTDTTINIVRKIASELRPSFLDVLGLIEAIEWQSQQVQERTGIEVHCHSPKDDVDLNRDQSTAFFRIFQEALTNILRHAQGTTVDVTMVEEAGAFVLTIRDNGRGIKEDEKSGPLAIGLLGMRERARMIGSEIDITGVEGQGTTVTVRLPMVHDRTAKT
jgi:signal transduction histidine kinase